MKNLLSLSAGACMLALSACSSTPTNTATSSTASANGDNGKAAAGTSNATAMNSSTVRASALPADLDPNSALYKSRSVYFGFDDTTLDQQDMAVIEAHGKYLLGSPALKIKIEGNADDRGSAEYNLALGQKRAEATMKALRIMGVRDSQMEAISWGEEHPRAKGEDEAAWSQNRRADLVYPDKP